MTETRKWTVGTALVVVLLLLASWFLLISPKRGDADQLNAQAEAQLAKNQQLATQVTVLKQQYKSLPKMQAELAALQEKIPASTQSPSLIVQINEAAKKSGVSLQSYASSPPVAVGAGAATATGTAIPAGTLTAMPVVLQVNGGYFQIQQFVNELETLQRTFLATQLSVVEGQDTSSGSSTTTTSTSTGSNGQLSATINGRVYLTVPAPNQATLPSTVPGAVAPTPTATATTSATITG